MRFRSHLVCIAIALSFTLACGDGKGSSTSGHVECNDKPDGTSCTTSTTLPPLSGPDGGASDTEAPGRAVCVGSVCVTSSCGDGYLDTARGEECDDGNFVEADGCEPGSCTFTCSDDTVCDDKNACNGKEICVPSRHVCQTGMPPATGSACTLADQTAGVCRCVTVPGGDPNVCQDRICALASCGNGRVDSGEECDDKNNVLGDGCENDCAFTCNSQKVPGRVCVDNGTVCDGVDVCNANHVCARGTPPDCSKPPFKPNGCGRVECDPQQGCVYRVTTARGEVVPGDVIVSWIKQYQTVACDVCARQPAAVPESSGKSFDAPYCQVVGPIEKPVCFADYDYDCDGVLTPSSDKVFACIGKGCQSGWATDTTHPNPPLCGEKGTFRTCGSGALLCSTATETAQTQSCR